MANCNSPQRSNGKLKLIIMDLIQYSEMLIEIENRDNHLLLGNGFNYSLGVNTGYGDIFEVMKEHNQFITN